MSLLVAAIAVGVAGYVRGYGGFGFAMITVAALSLLFPLARVVPMVLLLDIGASLLLLPGVWRSVHWSALFWLLTGVMAGTPLGVWLLGTVPAAPMKLAVAAVIFVLALLMRQGWGHRRRSGRPAIFGLGTGLVSGVLNGAAAIGGPPAILFFFASPTGAAVSRASLIAFFLVTDILAALTCAAAGLMTVDDGRRALMLVLPLAAGLLADSRAFIRTPEERFRKRVLLYLMLLALLVVLRALQEGLA
jgi:hypothetical protein